MLGLGRAMGETIAVALVIGSSPQITANAVRPRRLDAGGHRQPVRRGRRPAAVGAHRPRRRAVHHHASSSTWSPRAVVQPLDPKSRGADMTATSTSRRPACDPTVDAPSAAGATVRNRLATVLMLLVASSSWSSRSASCSCTVHQQGPVSVIVARLPHRGHPHRARATGPGMGPAIVGTLAHHRLGARCMAVPLGILGADLPARVRQATGRWPGSCGSWPT